MSEITTNTKIAGLSTRLRNTGPIDEFTAWLVKLMMSGAKSEGFWSSEIIPPAIEEQQEWTLVQRFNTAQQAQDWLDSPVRKILLKEAGAFANAEEIILSEEISSLNSLGSVATAIVTEVNPEMETEYWQWQEAIQQEEAKFPGYAGVYLEPPRPGKPHQWTTVVRFNSPQDLEAWFSSPIRLNLLDQSKQFIKTTNFQKLSSSFPGWFPLDEKTGERPPKWKTAVLVLLGLFPVVMLLKRFLLPLLINRLDPALANAINTIASVSLVTWVTMPVLLKAFDWWLLPKGNKSRVTTLGCLAALCLFVAEIVLLWNLLTPTK